MKNTFFTVIIFGLLTACNSQSATETETVVPETEQQEITTEPSDAQAIESVEVPVNDTVAEVIDSTIEVE